MTFRLVRTIALGVIAMAAAAPPAAAQTVMQQPFGKAGRSSDAGRTTRGDGGGKIGSGAAADAKYDAGMAAIRANNPTRAVELMRPVLADFEKRYAAEKRQIYCAVTPEQSSAYLADAAKARREAVAIDDGWCRAQYVTGYALIDLQRLTEAQTAFERLVRFAPQNSRYLNELGYVFMKQKKWQASLDAYRRSEAAADLSPDRSKEERCLALKGIGYDLVELGDLNAAEAAYRKCLNIDPDDKDSPRELDYIAEQRKLTV